MYVVVIEQLLDGVELPVRDGIVKLQDCAELRRRVGDGHSHDGSCRCVLEWVLTAAHPAYFLHRRSELGSELEMIRIPLLGPSILALPKRPPARPRNRSQKPERGIP
jgi:hypothetical protein